MAPRRRLARSHTEAADAAAEIAPERADVHARVLALQRSAGNAAVAGLLRAPQPPRAGGWNETGRDVAATLRLPITGIKLGNQAADGQGGTTESAAGRAVVVVPDGVDLTAGPDVLLFFHGMGNLGYRERTTGDPARGPAGTVHDVEVDRMEQQLAHSGRNLIGVLPQGRNDAVFLIADPQAYLNEVLPLAAAKIPAFRPDMKVPSTITPGRVIVAGHSGGGRAAVSAATALNAKAPVDDDAWVHAPPLFLFDGINGPIETGTIGNLMEQWLNADRAWLKAAKEPEKLLERRRIRLRSTHTSTDRYVATNLGGSYWDGKQITIEKEQSLKGRIDGWFGKHGKALGALEGTLRAQYEVPEQAVAGSHEATVGTGSLETDPQHRAVTPPGITDPSKRAGVPDTSGGGHLEDSLSRLPPDARRPPPPPPKHTLLDEAEPEELYA